MAFPKSKVGLESPADKGRGTLADKEHTLLEKYEKHAAEVDALGRRIIAVVEDVNPHPTVAMDAFEILLRSAARLIGEEEGQVLDSLLEDYHIKVLAIQLFKRVAGGSVRKGPEEKKESLDDLLSGLTKMTSKAK